MSHKTGKRVLATTATSALAFAGLIAMPLAAQAAPGDVTFTDGCGYTDTAKFKLDTGVYEFRDATNTLLAKVDTKSAGPTVDSDVTNRVTGTFNGTSGDLDWSSVESWTGAASNGRVTFTDPTEEVTSTEGAGDTYYATVHQLILGGTTTAGVTTGGTTLYVKAADGQVYTNDVLSTPYTGSLYVGYTDKHDAVDKVVYSSDDGGTLTYSSTTGHSVVVSNVLTAPTRPTGTDSGDANPVKSILDSSGTQADAPAKAVDIPVGWHVGGVDAKTSAPTGTYVSSQSDSGTLETPADGFVTYNIPSAWYETTTGLALKDVRVYGPNNTPYTSDLVAAGLDGLRCSSETIPVPAVNVSQRTITITKGTGLDWHVTSDRAGSTLADAADQNGANLTPGAQTKVTFASGASDSATAVVKAAVGANVKVEAVPAAGYTGTDWQRTYLMDGLTTQHTWVPPVVNDVNGQANDTFTVRNYNGVKYYYTTDQTLYNNTTSQTYVDTDLATRVDDPTNNVSNKWVSIAPSSGSTTTVNRPREIGSLTEYYSPVYVIALATAPGATTSGYGWIDTVDSFKKAELTFTDRTVIRSVPAPVMVDGAGAEDYYVLTAAEGVTWEVKDGNGNVRDTFTTNDPRYGTQVRVITTPGKTETWTFTAKPMDASHQFQSGLKTVWTGDFDNRPGITPAAPKFYDNTGLLNDQVEFPPLVAGIDYYEFALTVGTASPGANDYKQIDGSWYSKQVALPELQRYFAAVHGNPVDYQPTHVWIKAKNNVYVADLAKDADGNTVKADWNYEFKNAFTVVAEPPIQDDRPGTANDTLTFPNETRVVYKVTDEHGSTKTIGLADLGKPLHFTGIVKVTVEAAPGYQLQPNTDGSPFAGWTFEFDDALSAPITPGNPHSHDLAGTDQDTYELPNQPGVLWTADGVNVDPSTYGQRISTGGKTRITFVARPAQGYSFVEGAERTFVLNWSDVHMLDTPEVDYSLLPSGWQATASWEAPANAEGDVTYDVSFAKISEDEDGDEVVGPRTTWFEGTDRTSAQLNAGYNTKYRVYVTATDEHGTESDEGTTDIVYATDNSGAEANWVDINRSTVTPSGNDALGWYQAGSSLYFNNTAFVTYRDQSNITFTVNGGQQLRVYGTQYTKGGRALIQVNGTNWAWLDAGASSNADPYKKMLRQINLPNTGTHTIKIIASLLPGKELALDAYEVVK